MNSKVSVVITAFHRLEYLKEAIASVLKQNFKEFELIIVNDDPADSRVDRAVSH